MLERFTVAWVRAAWRARHLVLVLALVASGLAAGYVKNNLGINTDTADMISATVPWRQRAIDFEAQFAHFSDGLAVVLDAATADLADQAAGRLVAALRADTGTFTAVEWTGGSAHFRRNGFLYLDDDERRDLAADLVEAQPLLGRLSRDPSLATVADMLGDALGVDDAPVSLELIDRFAEDLALAVDAVLEGRFHRLSWRGLIASGAGDGLNERERAEEGERDAGSVRRVVVVRPVLDFAQPFPAAETQARIRETASRLGLTPERGVRVRITGGLAMAEEELRSVSSGMLRAGAFALAGVALVLTLGLGSLRLVLITLLTLAAGLVWTAAFAAAAVGHLNMISVAFAVLYIGLGVDYAVHFGLRFRETLGSGGPLAALESAARDVGGALALCALTTGVGFFAFLPTRFAGVSELGLIAGVGMFVSLAATLTVMPALLGVLPARALAPGRGLGLPLGGLLDTLGQRHARGVRVVAVAVALLCVLAVPQARFDDNPLNLRDPQGEALSTYRALVASGDYWSLDVLVDSSEAVALSGRLQALPQVRRVVQLVDFVPTDQGAALRELEELALLLGPDLDLGAGKPSDAMAARVSLRDLSDRLQGLDVPGDGMTRLRDALLRLHSALDAAPAQAGGLLERLQLAVTATLPDEIDRLADLLDADRITAASLPASIRRDWRAADGRLRLRVDAREDLNDPRALSDFVDTVRGVAPQAVGTPVKHLESGRVVVEAFAQAFALALLSIAVILSLSLRGARAALVVLAPLLLAALITTAVLGIFGQPFNFANVIALPLLLGIGVDSGVHMLGRSRIDRRRLSSSATARGVVTSALTTIVSFGNLAFSPHPGTASMGIVLSVGMVSVLMVTLILIPALVTRAPAPHAASP